MMKHFFIVAFYLAAPWVSAQTNDNRVVHNDPLKYRQLAAVHAGAGQMGFTQLVGRTELSTNFLYLHAGVINPKSGIGHHFHHGIEEMYVILNGEAEFTINGRTSKIKAPAVVPCKLGDAHGIYNPSGEPIRWLNYAVSKVKGRGDNFDLGDTREGVSLDPIPVFVSGRLEKDKLKANNPQVQMKGALTRRVIGPDVFKTDWNHVDHIVIRPDSSTGKKHLEGIEEVYYVIKGSGSVTINKETSPLQSDDAFYSKLGEEISIKNNGKEDLEILVIGIAASKQKLLNIEKPLAKPKAMVLQMDFIVSEKNAEAFEKMYYSIYVPALTVQPGYLGSKLLRLFPEPLAKQIQAEPTSFNYQIQLSFDTEENRMHWVKSAQHEIAWPAASRLAEKFKWRGYEVMGDDVQE